MYGGNTLTHRDIGVAYILGNANRRDRDRCLFGQRLAGVETIFGRILDFFFNVTLFSRQRTPP